MGREGRALVVVGGLVGDIVVGGGLWEVDGRGE